MKLTKKLLDSLNLGFKFPAQKTKWYAELDDFDCVEMEVFSEKQYKSLKQNALFHSLISCFWRSGCSSFASYDDLRRYYKRIAGLISFRYDSTLTKETKEMLWKAIKLLPIEQSQRVILINMLKGRVEQELSWAEVSKKAATETIDHLLNDMELAGVPTSSEASKYEEIMKGLGEFYDEFGR